ncbi:MAG: cytochrome C oxidase subunit IV family protein [Chlamydiota bacterium]
MDDHYGWNFSTKPPLLGCVASLILLYAGYRLDQVHLSSPTVIAYTILFLCVLQALLQFFFFLHIGLEARPKWNLYAFLFTTFIVILVVSGTIWIMQNLDYNLMRTS